MKLRSSEPYIIIFPKSSNNANRFIVPHVGSFNEITEAQVELNYRRWDDLELNGLLFDYESVREGMKRALSWVDISERNALSQYGLSKLDKRIIKKDAQNRRNTILERETAAHNWLRNAEIISSAWGDNLKCGDYVISVNDTPKNKIIDEWFGEKTYPEDSLTLHYYIQDFRDIEIHD